MLMSTLKKQQLFTVHALFVNFELKTVTVKTYGNEKKCLLLLNISAAEKLILVSEYINATNIYLSGQ
jgi:hypothetical protein